MATSRGKAKQTSSSAPGDVLRLMPSVDDCLKAAAQRTQWAQLSRPYLASMIRHAQAQLRSAIAGGTESVAVTRDAMMERIMELAARAIAADVPRLRPVINATGVVIHTNLGRTLLAEAAIDAVAEAARSFVNLEYDLASGGRGDRDDLIEQDLLALTGAEAATVVNNNAAAVLLALNSLAVGREVIVSRGELIEIGGAFRIPDVMAKSGAVLREVGTTNRTHLRDYDNAIGPQTALLLKVHPSNYRVVGFTSEVELPALVQAGRAHELAVMEDLGSGALVDLGQFEGLPREPLVRERIEAGASIVTFSGDKLLGGPQAGMIVGQKTLIDKIKQNPLKRALRCDKLTLAALSATLRLYLRSADWMDQIPTLRLLRRSPGELERHAQIARAILSERLGKEYEIAAVDSSSQIGSGAQPTEEVPSRAVRITHPVMSADAIAAMFRGASTPIIGRVKDGAFLLDMRTIEDASVLAVDFPR